MAPRKSSETWNHFSELANSKAKCGYYSKILSTAGGSFGNLNRHLKTVHPAVLFSKAKEIMDHDENLVYDPASHADPPVEALNIPGSSVNNTSLNTTRIQSNIMSFMQSKKIYLNEFYPFSMVDDKEFRKLLKMLNPRYEIPCRQTISKNLIPKLYNLTLENLKKKVENAKAVSLTTDGWTCVNNKSYVAVTAHFIDEDKIVSVCLGCEHFPLQHTAINLAEYLKSITIEWKINNKVVAVVTDNAANMVSAVRQLHFRHIGCFAHSINLVVQNSLANISEIVSKVKKIVEFFKRSSNALTKLQSTQAQMGLPLLKLKQDYAVISTLALLQSSIDTLTPEEWDTVDKAILILQIFNEVTIEVSSEKTVSISKKIVLVSSMTATVDTYVNDISLPCAVHQMAVSLKSELQKRFKDIEENEIVAQASILDPRFKKYGFTDE
ncbi:zinc finger BED domain-containing protein 4-like, partial [Aphis craccivora]